MNYMPLTGSIWPYDPYEFSVILNHPNHLYGSHDLNYFILPQTRITRNSIQHCKAQASGFLRFIRQLRQNGDGRFRIALRVENGIMGCIDYYLHDPNSNLNICVSDSALALLQWSKEHLDNVWSNGESLDEVWFNTIDVRNNWRFNGQADFGGVEDNTSDNGGELLCVWTTRQCWAW